MPKKVTLVKLMNLKSSREVIKQYIIYEKNNIHQSQNKSRKYFSPNTFFQISYYILWAEFVKLMRQSLSKSLRILTEKLI